MIFSLCMSVFVCVCFIYSVVSSFLSQFNYLFTFIYIFGPRSVDKGKQKVAASDHENKQWSVLDAHTCGNPSLNGIRKQTGNSVCFVLTCACICVSVDALHA